MRYLQTYKLFESSWDLREDDLKILKDFFLELEDQDFRVSFYKTSDTENSDFAKKYISISISKDILYGDTEQFKWEDIEDTFLTAKEYIDDNGYSFESGMLVYDDESIINRRVKNDIRFYDYESLEKELKSDKKLHQVMIKYSLKK